MYVKARTYYILTILYMTCCYAATNIFVAKTGSDQISNVNFEEALTYKKEHYKEVECDLLKQVDSSSHYHTALKRSGLEPMYHLVLDEGHYHCFFYDENQSNTIGLISTKKGFLLKIGEIPVSISAIKGDLRYFETNGIAILVLK